MRSKWYWCAFVSVIAVAAVVLPLKKARASNAGAQPAESTIEVKIDNFSFSPRTLTVESGTTVKWTNRDDIPHTVVSNDQTTFKSKVLDTDDTFTFTFTKTGTYDYFCSVHPKMTAKVVVK